MSVLRLCVCVACVFYVAGCANRSGSSLRKASVEISIPSHRQIVHDHRRLLGRWVEGFATEESSELVITDLGNRMVQITIYHLSDISNVRRHDVVGYNCNGIVILERRCDFSGFGHGGELLVVLEADDKAVLLVEDTYRSLFPLDHAPLDKGTKTLDELTDSFGFYLKELDG